MSSIHFAWAEIRFWSDKILRGIIGLLILTLALLLFTTPHTFARTTSSSLLKAFPFVSQHQWSNDKCLSHLEIWSIPKTVSNTEPFEFSNMFILDFFPGKVPFDSKIIVRIWVFFTYIWNIASNEWKTQCIVLRDAENAFLNTARRKFNIIRWSSNFRYKTLSFKITILINREQYEKKLSTFNIRQYQIQNIYFTKLKFTTLHYFSNDWER